MGLSTRTQGAPGKVLSIASHCGNAAKATVTSPFTVTRAALIQTRKTAGTGQGTWELGPRPAAGEDTEGEAAAE